MDNGGQLLLSGADRSRFFYCFRSRFGIKSVKQGGTNKDGEKQGDDIHPDTEEKRLPAANCVKG